MSTVESPINTKKVKGRREVRYESLRDLLADAERLAQIDNVRQLGNWTRGQIFDHLATSFNFSLDGFDFSVPAPMRFVMSLLFKKKFLNVAIPTGFKAPAKFTPPEISVEDGLANLRKAIERQENENHREPHPGFGKITNDEWEKFNLRHAEMHMSFLIG